MTRDALEPAPQPRGGYAAVDVHYLDGGRVRAALVAAADPRFSRLTAERAVLTAGPRTGTARRLS